MKKLRVLLAVLLVFFVLYVAFQFTNMGKAFGHSAEGQSLSKQGNYENAIVEFDKAITLYPKFANFYDNKGAALDNLGKHEKAIIEYDKAIKLNPKFAFAYYNKGLALSYLGKFEEAIALYDKTIELDPKYAYAYNSKAARFTNSANMKMRFRSMTRP